jgi:hypothetical protein
MKRLNLALRGSGIWLGDLLPLSDPVLNDSEVRLERVYQWCFERTMTLTRIALAAAGAAVLALVSAFIEGNHPTLFEIVSLSVAAVLFTAIGIVSIIRVAHLHAEYAHNLRLLMKVRLLHEAAAERKP